MTAIQVYCKNPESVENAATEPVVDSAVNEVEPPAAENLTTSVESSIQPDEQVPFVQPVDPFTGKKRSQEEIEGIEKNSPDLNPPPSPKKLSKTWFQWLTGGGE
jgi:hypothetical protein